MFLFSLTNRQIPLAALEGPDIEENAPPLLLLLLLFKGAAADEAPAFLFFWWYGCSCCSMARSRVFSDVTAHSFEFRRTTSDCSAEFWVLSSVFCCRRLWISPSVAFCAVFFFLLDSCAYSRFFINLFFNKLKLLYFKIKIKIKKC